MAIAMEKLFGLLPPPAAVAGCSGCQSVAKFMTPTFNGTAQPNATQLWSTFGFTFNGTCNSSYLTTYGQNGEPRPGCCEHLGCKMHNLSWLMCCTSMSALYVSSIVLAWAERFPAAAVACSAAQQCSGLFSAGILGTGTNNFMAPVTAAG